MGAGETSVTVIPAARADRDRAELAGIANRRRWWLVPATAVQGRCVASAEERERERRLQREE